MEISNDKIKLHKDIVISRDLFLTCTKSNFDKILEEMKSKGIPHFSIDPNYEHFRKTDEIYIYLMIRSGNPNEIDLKIIIASDSAKQHLAKFEFNSLHPILQMKLNRDQIKNFLGVKLN